MNVLKIGSEIYCELYERIKNEEEVKGEVEPEIARQQARNRVSLLSKRGASFNGYAKQKTQIA